MKRYIIALATVSLATTVAFADQPSTNNSFTQGQQKSIEQIVHHYLITHPEVLVEASQALQAKQNEQQEDDVTKAMIANKEQLFHDPSTPTFNKKDTKAYVVEFFDYQCGHCRTVAPEVTDVIAHNKNITVIFKELPIFGGASDDAARMALIAYKQGHYLALHNALFSANDLLTKQGILDFAKQVGMNTSDVSTELNNPQYEKQIQNNFALAQKLGIMGTPAFVISNAAETKFQLIPGATNKQGLETALQAIEE